MRARDRPLHRSSKPRSRSDVLIARLALAIVGELERCASIALRWRRLGIASSAALPPRERSAAAVEPERRLADENRRLKKCLRELAADKAILQHILKRKS